MKKFMALILAMSMTSSVFANSPVNTADMTEAVSVEVTASEQLVLARDVADKLGYEIEWDGVERSITLTKGDDVYKAVTGSTEYLHNGSVVLIANAMEIIDDRSYVPLSFVELFLTQQQDSSDYIAMSEDVLTLILEEKYDDVEVALNQIITSKDLKDTWDALTSPLGEFKGIDTEKYEVNFLEEESFGEYVQVLQYVEYEKQGLVIVYYYDANSNIFSWVIDFYELENDEMAVLPEGLEEIDYVIGIADAQNAKLTRTEGVNSDTVVILVAGSGSSDLDENVYGNTPFRDLAWGLGQEGIDTFRYDKVTYAIMEGRMTYENGEYFNIDDEYFYDVKYVTNMLVDMGYENIYILGHSLGGMMAPALYEDNEGIYDGLIILAGTPRTLIEVGIDQALQAIDLMEEGETKEAYTLMVEEDMAKLETFATLSDEELAYETFLQMSAYYLVDMTKYDTGAIAEGIDKPFLVLQGSQDFQVFEDPDFELWKEVLEDNDKAEFVLYDNLGHFFTQAPENSTFTAVDYVPAQRMDTRVIEDIVAFINQYR